MKLEKALFILINMGTPNYRGHSDDILKALKLRAEALKRFHRYRLDTINSILDPLPGETKY